MNRIGSSDFISIKNEKTQGRAGKARLLRPLI